MINKIGFASALLMGLAFFGVPTGGHAAVLNVLNQTSDDCSGGCGGSTGNTITVTGSSGTFDIQVQLASGWHFMGNFGPQTITFALPTSISTLTFGAVTVNNNPPVATATNNQFWSTAWAPAGFPSASNGATTFTQSAASYGPPGVPSVTNAFQVDWNNGSGASKEDGSFIDFTVSNAALTLAMLMGTTVYVDVFSGINGNTGIINFSLGPSINPLGSIPLPPAALLFGSALMGLGILGRRRKNGLRQA